MESTRERYLSQPGSEKVILKFLRMCSECWGESGRVVIAPQSSEHEIVRASAIAVNGKGLRFAVFGELLSKQ